MASDISGVIHKFITIFSQDGELLQVEFAIEAMKQSVSTSVALKGADCAIVVAEKKIKSKFIVSDTVSSVFRITKHIGCMINGRVGDSRSQVQRARLEASQWRHRFGYDMPIDVLCRRMANINHLRTMHSELRSLACSMTLIAYDDDLGPAVYMADLTGGYYGFHAVTVGDKADAANCYLNENFKPNLCKDKAIQLAITCLSTALAKDLSADNMEIGVVSKSNPEFQVLDADELNRYLLMDDN